MKRQRYDWNVIRPRMEAMLAEGAGYAEMREALGVKHASLVRAMRAFGLRVRPDVSAAKRRANIARILADPALVAKSHRAGAAARRKPEVRAKISRGLRAAWAQPDVREQWCAGIAASVIRLGPERLAERGKKAWANRRAKAAEAERRAKLTPFERLLEDVKAGKAKIAERPVLRAPELDYSLTGSTLAL